MIYWVMFRQRFQNGITNVRSFLWDYVVDVFFDIAMYAYVYDWICKESGVIRGMTFIHVFTYLVLVMLFSHISKIHIEKLAHKVAKGDFLYELLLPYSYPVKIATEAAADFCSGILIKVLPVSILLAAWGKIVLPGDFGYGVLALISLLLGVLLRWGMQTVLQLFGFWYKGIIHVRFIMFTVFQIFCGGIIPFWFFPKGILEVLWYTPFGYVWLLPMEIYFGSITVTTACWKILVQLVWIGVMVFFMKIIYTLGKYHIQTAD